MIFTWSIQNESFFHTPFTSCWHKIPSVIVFFVHIIPPCSYHVLHSVDDMTPSVFFVARAPPVIITPTALCLVLS